MGCSIKKSVEILGHFGHHVMTSLTSLPSNVKINIVSLSKACGCNNGHHMLGI